MPFLTADVTDERDGLATFARQQLRQIATTLHDLDDAQLRDTASASGFSPGTLARHVIAVAEGFAHNIRGASAHGMDPGAGEAADESRTMGDESRTAGSEHSSDATLSGDGDEDLRDGDTAQSLIDELEAVADGLGAAIRSGDLDAPVPVPEAPWFSGEESWTVRWVALHCIEEVARHAGHADIIRESIDGKGAYELNALADGEEWPPAGW